jgi:hypothetical protein
MKTSHIIALTICLTIPTIQANDKSSLQKTARSFFCLQSFITGLLVSAPAIFAENDKSAYLRTGAGFMVIAAGISDPSSDLIIHGTQLIFDGITTENAK